MVNWKDSFERINTELDLTKRKKQTLDSLHDAGRISQFAYECLNKGLTEELEEVVTQRKALTEKMTRKLNELEEQRVALEMFLANTEMSYVAGDIDQEVYTKESGALDLGLDATKRELDWIKDAIVQLVPKEGEPSTTPTSSTPSETMEVAAETVVEKPTEATPNVPVEVPAEVPSAASEAKMEQIQAPQDAPTPAQTPTSEGGEAPFREQGGNPPT